MASRAQRRQHRHTDCVLCLEPIAGYRMELGATWVAHATCWDAFADSLHRVGTYSHLPRRSEEYRTAARAHLTGLARRLYARKAAHGQVNGRQP